MLRMPIVCLTHRSQSALRIQASCVIIVLQRGEAQYQKDDFPNTQKDPDPEVVSGLTLENNPNPRKQWSQFVLN